MQAVILAGGKGTRLAARLNGRPKPLIDVDGVPLMERQLRSLERDGVDDVVVLVNHAADQIERFIAARAPGARISLIDDGDPRGTAGATIACLDRLAEQFLVVYGDTLFDIDIAHVLAAHTRADVDATLLLHPNDHPADSDLVDLDEDGRITGFHAYPHPPGALLRNLVNAAFYVVERRALEPWRDSGWTGDFAKDLFPELLRRGGLLHGYISYEYIKDLGTPARLDKAERHLRSGLVARASRTRPQAAVFVDRDGTINQLHGYIRQADELRMLPGAAVAIRALNDTERRVILLTNQPVLARGEVDAAGMRRIHAKLDTELSGEGAILDAVYLCPHHPDGGFVGEVAHLKVVCDCRKPGTAMIETAIADLNIDRNRAWLIGDSTADMLAANRAGILAVLVRTGEGGRDGKWPGTPDFIVADIGAATALIVNEFPRLTALVAPTAAAVAPGDVVLVGGLARSGKTRIAAALRAELRRAGRHAVTVSLDRWIRPAASRDQGFFGRYAMDDAVTALKSWLAGEAASVDLPFHRNDTKALGQDERVTLPADAVLIVEGAPALLLSIPSGRTVHRVHVDACEQDRARRELDDQSIGRHVIDADGAVAADKARQVDEAPLILAEASRATQRLTLDTLREEPV